MPCVSDTVLLLCFRYLELTTPQRLGEIFKSDLDADLLAEIIYVLVVTWNHIIEDDEAVKRQEDFAIDTLEALSKTDRLSLILDFLDNNQVEKLQTLFQLLERGESFVKSGGNQEPRLAALKSKFNI